LDLNHENIIKIYEIYQDEEYRKRNGKVVKRTILVLEYAENGEIYDYISETGAFSEPVCRYFMNQILLALKHCHEQGYTHRDIKPENIFLSKDFNIKLADFGFTTFMN